MKLLVVTPHLSTGGMPQYLLKYIEHNKNKFSNIKVVEFSNFSKEYIIQRDKIINLVGVENFDSLGSYEDFKNKEYFKKTRYRLLDIINSYNPDCIYMSEFPECYEYILPPHKLMNSIYRKGRKYKIIETTHNNSFDFKNKKYIPDEFLFCSDLHIDKSADIDVPKTIWEYPIEKHNRPDRDVVLRDLGLDPSCVHVLNVGLFNPNKNQKYIFNIAEGLIDKKVIFHFIGNNCYINKCDIKNTDLKNCKLWGERDDVEKFMSCMDLYLFPSIKELNPLTIKEALSWGMEVIVNEDENYTHQYQEYSNFHLIGDIDIKEFINNKYELIKLRRDMVHKSISEETFSFLMAETESLLYFKYFDIEQGDIVVDLGACIGTFAAIALKKNAKKCYSLECSSPHFEDLIENVKNDNRCIAINKAIGITDENKVFAKNSWTHESQEVEIISLKSLVEEYRISKIDFLKIDVEGYEYAVLLHDESYDWIKCNVNKIVGEIHLLWNSDSIYNPMGAVVSDLSLLLGRLQNDFNLEISSIDGTNITESFINNYYLTDVSMLAWDYYREVTFHAENKKDVRHEVVKIEGKFLMVSSFYNNTREHILQTFNNVINQTYKNWVLIVGDDFSTNGCGDILREEVEKINHPNILFYDVKFKRELHLCQNFFKTINYDYYFVLDSDDILSEDILETYYRNFEEYPNVFSIFCDGEVFSEEGNLARFSIVRHSTEENCVEEFNNRNSSSYYGIWEKYHSWSMYGYARCFRKSQRSKFPIVKNCKTSADTFVLFNCLYEGDHLHLPRNLYTVLNRQNSDSNSTMSSEEVEDYNANALLSIEEYAKNKKYGIFNIYDNIWLETSALSYSIVAKNNHEINLISDINESQLDKIKFLYPDKIILVNDLSSNNLVIIWNKLNDKQKDRILDMLSSGKYSFSIYNFLDDFKIDEDDIEGYFQDQIKSFMSRISQNIGGYSYFHYFRHIFLDKVVRK